MQKVMSMTRGKGLIIPPERAVCLSPGGQAGVGLISPQPASAHTQVSLQGWGPASIELAFTKNLYSAQGWGLEHKGLIQETDVNFFQAPEAEGQSFQASEGRWWEERQSPRRLHQPTSNTRPVGKDFGKSG